MVIDAMLVCFSEDCKANDGTTERPYYMSNSLRVSFYFQYNQLVFLRLNFFFKLGIYTGFINSYYYQSIIFDECFFMSINTIIEFFTLILISINNKSVFDISSKNE